MDKPIPPRRPLQQGVQAGIITEQQAQALEALWQQTPEPAASSRFDLTHLLYYLGALMAIGAMTVFMELGWERFGGFGVLGLALLYGVIGLGLQRQWEARGLPVPAGLALVFVVCLTPLAVYGLLQGLGWWPESQPFRGLFHRIAPHWLALELATLLAAVLALTWRRVPFLTFPLALSLWFLSLDVAELIYGAPLDWAARGRITMVVGALMILAGLYVERRQRQLALEGDFAFWIFLFGVVAFWGGLTSQESDSEWDKALYGAINLGMMLLGVLLGRRVFTLFGALGFFGYLGHLAWDLFRDSWWFPVVLTALGALVIGLGVLWQRHQDRWQAALRRRLPWMDRTP
ncbi:DUF2157 domain-containing protein [Ferrimonas balearica]|uniref:DUF2157 domain-containing protein n=1 Tax=Ferrimonas balearica TaxID=44012 RepID=UPI001C992581|nr:DUF2157 domain-containing protein [Ferrimonas balearica]MBY5991199.1 DUF2157 domain-containing protein [Ferrimonas balearica]